MRKPRFSIEITVQADDEQVYMPNKRNGNWNVHIDLYFQWLTKTSNGQKKYKTYDWSAFTMLVICTCICLFTCVDNKTVRCTVCVYINIDKEIRLWIWIVETCKT